MPPKRGNKRGEKKDRNNADDDWDDNKKIDTPIPEAESESESSSEDEKNKSNFRKAFDDSSDSNSSDTSSNSNKSSNSNSSSDISILEDESDTSSENDNNIKINKSDSNNVKDLKLNINSSNNNILQKKNFNKKQNHDKGKQVKNQKDDNDIDAVLAEIEGRAAPQFQSSKGKGKKKGGKVNDADDDIDALLAEIEGCKSNKISANVLKKNGKKDKINTTPVTTVAATTAATTPGASTTSPSIKPSIEKKDENNNTKILTSTSSSSSETKIDVNIDIEKDNINDATEAGDITSAEIVKTEADGVNVDADATPDKPSKSQLKKQKKKLQQQKKLQQKQASSDDEASPKASGKRGPQTAIAKAAQQRLLLLQQQQRKIEEAEEERKKIEEEERKRIEEAERERQRDIELKQQRRQERRQRLKEEGKLLSAKERENQRKQRIYLQQLQQKGIVIGDNDNNDNINNDNNNNNIISGSKAIDDRKKKKNLNKNNKKEEIFEDIETKEFEEEKNDKKNEPQLADDWEDLLNECEDVGEEDTQVVKKKEKIKLTEVRKRAAMEAAIHEAQQEAEQRRTEASLSVNSNDDNIKDNNISDKSNNNNNNKKGNYDVELRSPICCILGHVDTGKTKVLDKIRHTNVQLGEAGGITQQIGATFFPKQALLDQCKKIDPNGNLRLPGLLIIDTPGHASFTNLRARGSSLCDLAIVVVDIMHGMEPQTRESLDLLKQKKCPFVIALNKIDRLYNWKAVDWGANVKELILNQNPSVRDEFNKRCEDAIVQLAEEGFNCSLYWENDDIRRRVSIVPTSAVTGEGIADLIHLICLLNQTLMQKTITKIPCIFDISNNYNNNNDNDNNNYKKSKGRPLQCTILEVKAIDGLGTTIDVILVQGVLYEGDTIVCCGMHGPILTTIRALLTPQPLKELRVKGEYIQHNYIQASMGVKIAAPNLEEAVAGTSMFVVEDEEDIDDLQEEVMKDMSSIFKSVDRSGNGVYVMASTLGSLEALLVFLEESKIPVFAVNIGPVQKKDVKRASIMREKGKPEYAVILAFNVRVDTDVEREAKSMGVKIMTAEIIYHLFDEFTQYFEDMKTEKKKEHQQEAVFPCILSIMPQFIFNKKDPLILGVVVTDGILKIGTPLCVPEKGDLRIGRVTSLEVNRKPCERATKGQEVCIKIVGESSIMIGRQFEIKNKLCSRITRNSIDCLKEHFRDELTKDDWKTVIQLKKLLDIP